ncbi:MAG TPA: peptidyl-prolyl cis-trans isomerase [Gemmatimonadaceae bacterium]|nr:peptidyl-prolyl cis-trans isomerase [Gemmatimonadaceae bacterium]
MLHVFRAHAKWIWYLVIPAFLIWFVYIGQSGLGDQGPVTPSTTIAKINGTDVTYRDWLQLREQAIQRAQQQTSGQLSLDDEQRIEDDAFNDMVNNILLQQEYKKRDITVSDQEIQQAALEEPPPQILQDPQFQTDGQFDLNKYRRYLSSPIAKESGIRLQLEQYYRGELPREKLFEQIASQVYVTDAQLWRAWQDTHDSAQISYVRFDPSSIPDSAVHVSAAEIQQYFDQHKADFADRPGHAIVTLAIIPRPITKADTDRVYQHALELRKEILAGAKFEDVAKRESADSASAVKGGYLGRVTKGQFVHAFDSAAFSLKPGELSPPVLTQFGYHIIKVDERKGDTIAVRHILLTIHQGDSSAAISDRRADSLSHAADLDTPAEFGTITKRLGLTTAQVAATEGDPLTFNGQDVPSVSAWAFTAKVGQTSDLIDADRAYYLARLDSLTPGGKPTLASMTDQIRSELIRQKKLDMLVPVAQKVSDAYAKGQTFDQAAKAAGLTVSQSPTFSRVTPVPGIGQANEVIGAAFGLPTGTVSEPVKSGDAVYVIKVDRRVDADRAAWQKQKSQQRTQLLQRLRQQRVQEYLADLRQSAKIDDRRKQVEQQTRQPAS